MDMTTIIKSIVSLFVIIKDFSPIIIIWQLSVITKLIRDKNKQ